MQVMDCWEGAEDDSDGGHPLPDTPVKEEQLPRSKAARIKHRQAERALGALISDQHPRCPPCYRSGCLQTPSGSPYNWRMAEYMLGSRTGIDRDASPLQLLPCGPDAGSVEIPEDGAIPGFGILNPQTVEEFQAFKDFLVPLISRNFDKGAYLKFLEVLVLELAKDMKGVEVKNLGIILVRFGNEMMGKRAVGNGTSMRGWCQIDRAPKSVTNKSNNDWLWDETYLTPWWAYLVLLLTKPRVVEAAPYACGLCLHIFATTYTLLSNILTIRSKVNTYLSLLEYTKT